MATVASLSYSAEHHILDSCLNNPKYIRHPSPSVPPPTPQPPDPFISWKARQGGIQAPDLRLYWTTVLSITRNGRAASGPGPSAGPLGECRGRPLGAMGEAPDRPRGLVRRRGRVLGASRREGREAAGRAVDTG